MALRRIVDNPAAGTLTGTEVFPAVQTGIDVQMDLDEIAAYVGAAAGAVTSVNGATGAVVLELGDLDDVSAAAPSNGDVLAWNSGTSEWEPTAGGGSGGQVDAVSSGTGISVDSTDPTDPVVSLSSGSIASLALADSAVQPGDLATVATTGDVDDLTGFPGGTSNYLRADGAWAVPPGGSGGQVDSVSAGTGISVDSTDPTDPVVSLSSGAQASLSLADSSLQPGDNITALTNNAGYTANTGTVTSVAASVPTGLEISGSPVTNTGTLAITYASGYQMFTATEASKLSGIAAGATVGATWGTDLSSIPAIVSALVGLSNASGALTNDGSGGLSWVPAGGGGTVTSVAASVPTGFTIAGSPVTTSGTLAIGFDTGYQGYTSAEASKLAGIAAGATANTGTVTSVGTGTGLTGGAITATGTVSLSAGSIASLALADTALQPGAAAITDAAGNVRDIPQNLQNSNYTLVLSDRGKHIISTNTTNYAWTIPPNSSVAFPIGAIVTFIHDSTSGAKTLTQGSGVTIITGTTTGNIAIAAGEVKTALKVGTDRWRVL